MTGSEGAHAISVAEPVVVDVVMLRTGANLVRRREPVNQATSAPARAFGLEDRGRIAPGLRADLVLVDGDPERDITATRSIVGVWKRGVAVERVRYPE